jgi:hypothetical protein
MSLRLRPMPNMTKVVDPAERSCHFAGLYGRSARDMMAESSGAMRSRKGRSMHDMRFDHLARALSGRATRRSALALLAILGLANASEAPLDVAAKRRRHKRRLKCKCKSCWTNIKPTTSKRRCCARMKPDGSVCQLDGQCSGGECATPPVCAARDAFCPTSPPEPGFCCSDVCVPDGLSFGNCACSASGQPCHEKSDCCTGTCIGFVCTG